MQGGSAQRNRRYVWMDLFGVRSNLKRKEIWIFQFRLSLTPPPTPKHATGSCPVVSEPRRGYQGRAGVKPPSFERSTSNWLMASSPEPATFGKGQKKRKPMHFCIFLLQFMAPCYRCLDIFNLVSRRKLLSKLRGFFFLTHYSFSRKHSELERSGLFGGGIAH